MMLCTSDSDVMRSLDDDDDHTVGGTEMELENGTSSSLEVERNVAYDCRRRPTLSSRRRYFRMKEVDLDTDTASVTVGLWGDGDPVLASDDVDAETAEGADASTQEAEVEAVVSNTVISTTNNKTDILIILPCKMLILLVV
jgi:hypothetical protein